MTLLWGTARRLLILVLLVFVVGLTVNHAAHWSGLPSHRPPNTQAAIQLLRREELNFLVTERIVTQVVVEKHAGNLLLGKKDGYLIGTVELFYGLDLAGLDPTLFKTHGSTLHVTVPQPRLLRSVIDEHSLRFVQKRSPLFVLMDNLRNENLLQDSLKDVAAAASRFADTHDLAPTRDQLVARLNGYAPAIEAQTGVDVIFQ